MNGRPDDHGIVEVDARGLACPMPVVELAQAVAEHPVGTRFRLLATDTAAKVDIPVWCRMKRQNLISVRTDEAPFEFVVEKVRDA